MSKAAKTAMVMRKIGLEDPFALKLIALSTVALEMLFPATVNHVFNSIFGS